MAGQIGELARDTLRADFRRIDPRTARILLVEAVDRVLTTFPPSLSARATRSLERLGVTPLLGHTVVEIDDQGVTFRSGGQAVEIVQTQDRAVKVVRLLAPVGRAAAPLQTKPERASSSS